MAMNKRMTEQELCTTAWDVLQERLCPAEGVRFLSSIRNPGRDYQTWRQEHFRDLTTDRLVEGMTRTESPSD